MKIVVHGKPEMESYQLCTMFVIYFWKQLVATSKATARERNQEVARSQGSSLGSKGGMLPERKKASQVTRPVIKI